MSDLDNRIIEGLIDNRNSLAKLLKNDNSLCTECGKLYRDCTLDALDRNIEEIKKLTAFKNALRKNFPN